MLANNPSEAAVADAPSRASRRRIVAFATDEITGAAIRTGFDGVTQTVDVRRGDIRNALRLLEDDTEFHSVIADISGIDNPVGALEGLARVCPPDVQVALIGDHSDLSLYRTLLNMGVREYLTKPITRDQVQTILRPKLIGDEPDQAIDRGGHVVTVCGAQGGAGATTIAVNLALLLAETVKARVALLDMHLQGGETSVLLKVRPGPGLRIALEDPMRADTLFLERAAIEVNKRVRLIAGDEAMDDELRITEAGVRHVLDLLRQRFNYIVVDLPVPLVPALHPVVKLSRHVFVLLEAEVTGLRNARNLRTAVTAITEKNRVFTVLNRAGRSGGLPLAAIEKGLETRPDIIIPDLGKNMTDAVNQGIPALVRVPAFRRHLAPVVREIAGMKTTVHGAWIRRVFGL